MVFPGHIAAGYLTALGVVTFSGIALSPNEQALLLTLGALLGDGPDVDLFYSFFKKKTTNVGALKGHRDHITHMPLLWLLIGLFVFILTVSNFGKVLGILLWLCPWSHLLCDSLFSDVGVAWLRPFSNKGFTLFKRPETFPANWKDLFLTLLKNPLFYLEIFIALVAFVIISIRNF
ncbi:MAG: hypothetical protein JWP09_806 [Candidatus Taylorbacteria bacterium]|nr:hypothetical protein [Candidatus Taylorbacteria bacterium]